MKFAYPATLTTRGDLATVTAFNQSSDKPIYQADSRHPHWDEILEGLTTGDPNVWDLFDVAGGVLAKFNQVTDRVSWDGQNVLWDGDPIHSALSEQLRRALTEGTGQDYVALAKFWEKLESNPDDHSREQAYDWLASHKFQITEEGDIVGYKYVTDLGNGKFSSVSRSTVVGKPSAFVNGKAQPPLATVVQRVGDVVTMPRSEVVHNPSLACERGLHVGTWNYVGAGNRPTLEVHVNPRDVVSVPTDGGGEKVRVCRYKVHGVAVTEPGTKPVLRSNESRTTWTPDVSYRG